MSLEAARAALRARQGAGARYDAKGAPAVDLDLARRATAYFARVLNGFDDADLDGMSAEPGLPRRIIIAAVGLQARRMAETIARHRQTSETDPEPADIAEAATLPPHALRHLVTHAAVHLNVEWRDMGDADWHALIHLPRQRAETLWRASVALGGRRKDLPPGITAGFDLTQL